MMLIVKFNPELPIYDAWSTVYGTLCETQPSIIIAKYQFQHFMASAKFELHILNHLAKSPNI